jgi:hypothetical protein
VAAALRRKQAYLCPTNRTFHFSPSIVYTYHAYKNQTGIWYVMLETEILAPQAYFRTCVECWTTSAWNLVTLLHYSSSLRSKGTNLEG